MKTLQKIPMQLIEVEFIPEILEEGRFYYSEKYKTASHSCPCGCKTIYPIQIKKGEWSIINKENLTITPSLYHRINCEAHYIITDGFANIVNYPIEKDWKGSFNHEGEYDTHGPNSCPL